MNELRNDEYAAAAFSEHVAYVMALAQPAHAKQGHRSARHADESAPGSSRQPLRLEQHRVRHAQGVRRRKQTATSERAGATAPAVEVSDQSHAEKHDEDIVKVANEAQAEAPEVDEQIGAGGDDEAESSPRATSRPVPPATDAPLQRRPARRRKTSNKPSASSTREDHDEQSGNGGISSIFASPSQLQRQRDLEAANYLKEVGSAQASPAKGTGPGIGSSPLVSLFPDATHRQRRRALAAALHGMATPRR